MAAARQPLGGLSINSPINSPLTVGSAGKTVEHHVPCSYEDKVLFSAHSKSGATLAALGAGHLAEQSNRRRKAADSGGLALRALGHDVDSAGKPIYVPERGFVSSQLLMATQQLAAERQRSAQLEINFHDSTTI